MQSTFRSRIALSASTRIFMRQTEVHLKGDCQLTTTVFKIRTTLYIAIKHWIQLSSPILGLCNISRLQMRDLLKCSSTQFLRNTCLPMLKATRCIQMISRCKARKRPPIIRLCIATRLCKRYSPPRSSIMKGSWMRQFTRQKKSLMRGLYRGFSIIRAKSLTTASILMSRKDIREWCPRRCSSRGHPLQTLITHRWAKVGGFSKPRKITKKRLVSKMSFKKVPPILFPPAK